MASQSTRREFLQDSMLAAAAAAAVGTSRIVLADDAEQSTSANERLNIAILGVNGRGNNHIAGFRHRKDCRITHICDPDSNVGGRVAAGLKGAKYVPDLRKVFDDKSIDIVTIATPNHWHALAAIWAMQAGKDVYVEKPVSHNVSEGRRIVETARKYNKICQAGTQSRSNPGMRSAIDYVHSGRIGDVKVARGLCFKPRGSIGPKGTYPVPRGVDYDLWCGPAPDTPLPRKRLHYDWHWQFAWGNGDLGNQGIHQMDLARWGLGVDQLSKAVFSYGGRFGYIDAGDVANTQVVVHDYGDKSLVFEVRGLKTSDYKGAKIGVIYEGTDGYVVMTTYESGTAFDKDGQKIKSFRGVGDHFANFIKAVRSRKIQDLNGEILEGHLSSALCHMGNDSYKLGELLSGNEALERAKSLKTADDNAATFQRVREHLADNHVDLAATKIRFGALLKFDPKQEVYLGNDKANTLLSREYRKGFEVPAAV